MSQASHPTANLDDELGIPPEGTLSLPSNISPVKLVLELSSQDCNNHDSSTAITRLALSDLITPGTAPRKGISADRPDCISALISTESSMRASAIASPRSMIVGRQASVADIRVDHKSVSRRHTALYYLNVSHGSNSNGADHGAVLVVQDLGGKHGTYVNNKRLEKNGKVQLPLNGIDSLTKHTIRFGNAPLICNAEINAIESTQQQDLQKPEMDNPMQQKELSKLHSQHNLDEGIKSVSVSDVNNGVMISDEKALPANNNTSTDVASSRETREAQIAAMIASFDTKPVYKQYIQPNEENNDTPGNSTKITNNLSQSESNSNTNIQVKNNDNEYNLPITSSIILSPGSDSFTSSDGTNTPLQSKSSVATLCFEPSGSRLVAGHRDGSIRFYDFHGMKPATSSADSSSQITYPPFRIVDSDNDPLDQTGRHVLTAINPSPTGSQWIVGTTSSQPKVVDREGRATLFHFWKGDSYVTDASKTTGHTAGITGVAFHPLVKDVCWTCGLDGSIRQWDVSGRGKTQFGKLVCQKVLAKCKNEKGQRTQIVSCIGVHPSGRKLVVGTSCGSIQVWNCFGNMVSSRPLGAVYSAHGGSKPVTFVTFSNTGEKISSRSDSDDTVRVWDANRIENGSGSSSRKFKSSGSRGSEEQHPPSILLAICCGLPALNESANCAFSPDGKMICAGTSVDRGVSNSWGKLKFYKLPEEEKRSKSNNNGEAKSSSSKKAKTTATLEPIVTLDVAPGASVLGVAWHPKLNQVAFGTSNGIIQVLYDKVLSTKGALIPTARTIRREDGLSELLRSRAPTGSAAFLTSSSMNDQIIAPNALPLFREEPRETRKTRERDRKDPEKTKLPQPPVTGGIKTGSGAGGGSTFSQFIVESTNYVNNKNIAGKDPRAELFKYNEGKNYVSAAYEGDIQRIFAEKTVEEEEDEMKGRKKAKTK